MPHVPEPELQDPVAKTNSDPDKERGLYDKYDVQRYNDPEGKHDNCWYFVLDPLHDPLALGSLMHYAGNAYQAGYKELAADLSAKIREIRAIRSTEDRS